tara:strand:- start:31870 stop:33036 length:1167 start_codon:yes stop_codon:yes gene_type:complete
LQGWNLDWQRLKENDRAFLPQLREQNMRRLLFAAPLIPPINLLHLWLFWHTQPASPAEALWREGILLAHAGMLVFFTLLALAAWQFKRHALPRPSQACITLGMLGTLSFAALVSAIDQLVTSNITPLLLGCTLVALIFLHRPLSALLLFSFTLALFLLGIQQTQSDAALLISNQVNGLSTCAIGLALAWLQWRNFVQFSTQKQRLEDQQLLLEEQNVRLSYLADHDPLTGLLNRRAFSDIMQRELLRCQRSQQPLCLLMLDLDHFKTINDRYGHPVGDALIQQTARLLGSQVRNIDSLARIGGEEFVLLLVDCPQEQGRQIAEKLRQLVEQQLCTIDGHELRMTVSIGLSTLARGQQSSYESLYTASDRALYQAKHNGRNRVETVRLD